MDLNKELKREGVRGGREQFSWDSLKTQSHRDRQQYLGYSTKLGVAGRFGKYDRNDWWRTEQSSSSSKSQLEAERLDAQKLEENLMMEALGLKPKHTVPTAPDLKSDEKSLAPKQEDINKVTSTRRGTETGPSANAGEEDAKQVTGLGFRKYLKPADWTDVQDVEDILEANGDDIVVSVPIKKEIEEPQSSRSRMFGPARPPGVPIKKEAADDDHKRDRSRSRGRRDRP